MWGGAFSRIGGQWRPNFAQFGEVTAAYTLTVQVEGQGTVDPPEGTHVYGYGGMVTLTATPAPGWRFDRWEGAVTGAANPGTVVMTADRNVKAVFLPLGGGGSHACGATGKAAYACGMVLLWAVSRRGGKSPRRG